MSVHQLAWRHFTKKHSLSLRPDVVAFLDNRLSSIPNDQVGQIIEYIANAYHKYAKSAVVEMDILEGIIEQLFRSHKIQTEHINAKDYVHLVQSYPMLSYNPYSFEFEYKENATIQDRYNTLLERVQRHCKEHGISWKLLPVKSLKTRQDSLNVYSFGMIYEREQSEFVLEDLEDCILIKLEPSEPTVLVSGQFVVTCGSIIDSVYCIQETFDVPVDTRRTFLKLPGVPCPLKSIAKETETVRTIKEIEAKCSDACLACFSEVWLDQDDVLSNFESSLNTLSLSSQTPSIIVLLGSFFTSAPNIYCNPQQTVNEYIKGFHKLANVIVKFPKLVSECKFIICPGPKDPFDAPQIMPRQAFPKLIFESFEKCGIQFLLSGDPVRLFWFSKELVFSRDELTGRMNNSKLNLVHDSEASKFNTLQSANLALSQGFLQPFTADKQPIRGDLCSFGALALCPPPDLLVVAENGEDVGDGLVNGVAIGNPERFAHTRSFLLYHLNSNSITKLK